MIPTPVRPLAPPSLRDRLLAVRGQVAQEVARLAVTPWQDADVDYEYEAGQLAAYAATLKQIDALLESGATE